MLTTACEGLCVPAWPQTTCTAIPSGVGSPTGSNFFMSFADAGHIGTYGIKLKPNDASSLEGDLNATYFSFFYSIANALADTSQNGNCPFELVPVGTFPQARYFSITDNDMHYTNTQHGLDAGIDPVGQDSGDSYSNPYTPGKPYCAASMGPVTVN